MGFFSTTEETRDLHRDIALRTRYYSNNFNDVEKVIKSLTTHLSMELKQTNKNYGEMYLIGNGFDLIITALEMNPLKTSVDIKCNYFGFIGMNKPKKIIEKIYAYLDSKLKRKELQY